MAKSKKSGKKKSASPKRKSPKVKLNTKAVVLVAVAIVAVCAAVLVFPNLQFKTPGQDKPKESGEVVVVSENEATENKSGTPEAEKNVPKKNQNGNAKESPVYEKVPDEEAILPDDINQEEITDEIPSTVADKFNIPQAKNGAKICFVIDDAGGNLENVRRYASLPFPITIAVLPKLAHSLESAKLVAQSGKEVILHQPMQAHDYPDGRTPDPGPGALLPQMDSEKIKSTVRENLDELSGLAKGINNHEGSLVTENATLMDAVLSVTQTKGIYFLDSRTTSASSVPGVAESKGIKYIARFAPFLDNVIDRGEMLSQLYKGLNVANSNGYAVIIGHVDKSVEILPDLLNEIYPALVEKGYTLTTPSALY